MIQIEPEKWSSEAGVERARVSSEWRSRGFSCDLWVDPPGQRWDDFTHSTDELMVLVEGRLEVECEGEAAQIGVGDEWFIPSGAVHSVRNIGGTTARWLYGYRRKPRSYGP